MRQLLAELRRRNVIRIAIGYAAAAWLLLQIVTTTLPAFDAPAWITRFVIIGLLIGFPVALTLAWVFELTADGLQKDSEVDHGTVAQTQSARIFDRIVIIVLLIAVTLFTIDELLIDQAHVPGSRHDLQDSRSVAVMPFDNLSNDEANEPFTLGIHDDLLTQLSKIGSLRTISRTSVMQYRDSEMTVPEIASELGVANIVEGGIQRSGARVRINVKLVDADTDEQLWAETYDREVSATNIFGIQSEIATAIVQALQATLTADEQQNLQRVPTENIDALDQYFVGKRLLEERNSRSLRAAVEYFRRVVDIDPDFALAWSGLADAYMLLPEYTGTIDPDEIRAQSRAATAKAFELDPGIPEVLTSIGWDKLIHDYDWQSADEFLSRAVAIQSNNVNALHWYSHVLSWQGKYEEALEIAHQAVRSDPNSRLMNMNLAYILVDDGQYETGLDLAYTTIGQYPGFTSQWRNLWLHELRAGNPAAAARNISKWATLEGLDEEAATELGQMFVAYGNTGDMQEMSDELKERLGLAAEDLAQVYAFLGDKENALQALDIALEERSGSRSVLSMGINPGYDFMRDDPRFDALLVRAGLIP